MTDANWAWRRVDEAKAAVTGTAEDVTEGVADTLKELLVGQLQSRLKPEELRGLVKRLAIANNPPAE